jgi:autotransporter-associated beta strand protein
VARWRLTRASPAASTFTLSNVISDAGAGAGSLTKIGAGALTLTGTSTYSGATSVVGGALAVNGAITDTSSMTISGGTLTGTGTVNTSTPVMIAFGGTFMPGAAGSPGTSLTISGGLAFQALANYVVYLNPTTSTFANVTGSASLASGVTANFALGTYLSRKYTILTAAGGLGGTTFTSLTNVGLPAGFTDSLSYSADDVFLDLAAALGAVGTGGLNPNQRNVANALNKAFNSGATLPPSFVTIFGLTGGDLANALSQLSGESAVGAQQGAFQFGNSFLSLMLDPYTENRGSGFGAGGGFGPALGYAGYERTPPAVGSAFSALAKNSEPSSGLPGWNLWGAAFGGGQHIGGNGSVGSHNTTSSTGGFATGADYHVSPDAMVGFALAGGAMGWSTSGARRRTQRHFPGGTLRRQGIRASLCIGRFGVRRLSDDDQSRGNAAGRRFL